VKKPVRVIARSGKTSGKDVRRRQFTYPYPHPRADDSTGASTRTLIRGYSYNCMGAGTGTSADRVPVHDCGNDNSNKQAIPSGSSDQLTDKDP
jgi:hypothetical protein